MSNKEIPMGLRIANELAGTDILKTDDDEIRSNNRYNHIDLDKTNKLIKELYEFLNDDEFLKILKTNKEIHDNLRELVIKSIKIVF